MIQRAKATDFRDKVEMRTNVANCYNFFDCIFPACGLQDLTEGIYCGDPSISYEQAQRNQIEWLLDEVDCQSGSRILDLGCGYATLLESARRRGAVATGITISPPQVEHGRMCGLDVRLLDYRDIGDEWTGQFDGVIANGSVEHFVQPGDVLAGKADEMYRELFRICHRVLDPTSPSRRFATTIIHRNECSPAMHNQELLKGPFAFPWLSAKFHYAMLQKTFGGFYPEVGQLERCARPYFCLAGEVDGTADYHLTSEQCFARVRRMLTASRTGPRIWHELGKQMLRRPRHTLLMCLCLLVTESWQYQFRGIQPPTTLLRQTWEYCPVPRPGPTEQPLPVSKAL